MCYDSVIDSVGNLVDDPDEKRTALDRIMSITGAGPQLTRPRRSRKAIIRIEIESLTGKRKA